MKFILLSTFISFAAYTAAQYVTPTTNAMINQGFLLDLPPYRWFLHYSRPSYITDVYDQQLLAIASQYNMDISDLYQLFSIIDSNWASSLPDTNIHMIQQIAEAVQIERMRRGLWMSPLIHSNLYYNPVNRPYILAKRGPLDILSAMGQDASSTMSSLYNNLYNMADYIIPNTTQAFQDTVQDIVNTNIPTPDMSIAESLSSQLNINLRYMFD